MKTTKFKPSEVGPIPVDWEVKRLGEIGDVVTGSTPPRDDMECWGGNYNWISAKDFKDKYIVDSEEKVTSKGMAFCRLLPSDSVLVTCIASIGLNAIAKNPCATNQQINAVICKACNNEYLYYQIEAAKDRMIELAGQTAVPIINKGDFENLMIPLPPCAEQEKIAEALSDVDALLAATTKLIEKKRAIKQGAMQQLLTGKKRLAGFTGKWVEKRLGECSTMFAGGTPSSNVDGCYGGAIPWASISDISIAGKYIEATSETLTEEGLNNSSAKWYPQNTLLFAMYASIGKCCIARKRMTSSQAILGIYNFRDVDIEFLYYLLTFRNGELLTMGQTGTQANLSKSIVEDVIIDAPTLAEQKAIASVLSDMDAEVAALEAKRAKYERIKQGMMQELLTGKTRLED